MIADIAVEGSRKLVQAVDFRTDRILAKHRTFGNWLRAFAQFILTPLSPGFNLDRYDRELRRPFPRKPQFSTDSKVWRREHGVTEPAKSAAAVPTKATSGTSRAQWLESQ